MPVTRREFLNTSASMMLAAVVPNTFANSLSSETTMASSAFTSTHEAKPLPFDPAKLNGLSEKLLRSHWENNYGGSVKALNTIKKQLITALEDSNTPAFIYNDLKREHLMRTGSVVLHELYFGNLSDSSNKPNAQLIAALERAFGSFAIWEKEFKRMGSGLGGGSGWVVLGYNLHLGLLENYWLADHLHSAATTLPILVMDMYEHAYQMDYGASATAYVEAFFQNIQWDVVASRLEQAIKILE